MAKTHPGKIATNEAPAVRTATGAPVAADSATLSDGTFPPNDAVIGGGWRKVCVHPRFTGGSSPTVIVQPLFRMGGVWIAGTKSDALDEKEAFFFEPMGRDFFLRIDAVANNPTQIALHCAGWEPFHYDGPKPG